MSNGAGLGQLGKQWQIHILPMHIWAERAAWRPRRNWILYIGHSVLANPMRKLANVTINTQAAFDLRPNPDNLVSSSCSGSTQQFSLQLRVQMTDRASAVACSAICSSIRLQTAGWSTCCLLFRKKHRWFFKATNVLLIRFNLRSLSN